MSGVTPGPAGAGVPGLVPAGGVTSAMIANGAIVDDDVNAAAAIAGTKVAAAGAARGTVKQAADMGAPDAQQADTGGLQSTIVSTTGATNVTPWGYTTEAQANAVTTQLEYCIEDLNKIRGQVLDCRTDIAALISELTTLRTNLRTAGVMA